MLIIRSWPCPKCTLILLYITLNLKAYKINTSEASPESKKRMTFLKGWSGGGGGRGRGGGWGSRGGE